MSLNNETIKYIATLSRLHVDESDVHDLSEDLSNILKLVEQMNSVDTSNIEPMAHPMELGQRLRDDRVTEQDNHELYQSIAPQTENDLYLVPKVIE